MAKVTAKLQVTIPDVERASLQAQIAGS